MFGEHVGQKLAAYCHGELSPPAARRVTEHLLHCRRCRRKYEAIDLGAKLAARLAPSPAPASLWNELERLLERVEETGRARPARPADHGAPDRRRGRSKFASRSPRPAIACGLLLLLICSGAIWISQRRLNSGGPAGHSSGHPSGYSSGHPGPGSAEASAAAWQVTTLEGGPKIGERQIGGAGRLAVGEWLETDGRSRAQISVGNIGEVVVEPNSSLRLVQTGDDGHRLAIPRGKMQAFIWAPPRQFFVDLPSAVAVDLGCSYTLEVDGQGQGLLQVTLGWVAFEWEGRESFVPAEAECVTRPHLGPGTPYFSDVSGEFRSALATLDLAPPGDPARARVLKTVLGRSRRRDAFTLWHLLARTAGSERGQVYDRLAILVLPPGFVTRDGVVNGDRAMIDAWWDRLELGDTAWWRMWKGPVPSPSK